MHYRCNLSNTLSTGKPRFEKGASLMLLMFILIQTMIKNAWSLWIKLFFQENLKSAVNKSFSYSNYDFPKLVANVKK